MEKYLLLFILILLGKNSFEQDNSAYQSEFQLAYSIYPEIPKGLLEGVAFAQTRINHISGNHESCFGLPQVVGVMGLTENGQGYFKNNLTFVSELSGFSIQDIKSNPQQNILAYAHAYHYYMDQLAVESTDFVAHAGILKLLSEIPIDHNISNQYALNSFIYEVFRFMNSADKQTQFNFPDYAISYEAVFGEQNAQVLQASHLYLSEDNLVDEEGNTFQLVEKTAEYGPALWVATPTCNYSSRSGTAISAVTIHTIQGTYGGAISWAQNCSANVSYHYVVRSSDGQITQMVYEADKAWHVGSENPYTIGIEHEGYVDDPSWYTEALYVASADLVRDITQSGYGINPLRTFQGPATSGLNTLGGCIRIKGHQHYPSQTHTDPGINWNWEHYYQLINDNPTVTSYTTASGTIYDTGGASADYSDDERELYLIQPVGAVSVTISFATFDLENNWDYMYIYDGSSTTDPVLGVYTGSSNPGAIASTGGSILIEFRSDCNTTAAGYEINWSTAGSSGGDLVPPSSLVTVPNTWQTTDFISTFTDNDNTGGSGVDMQFYQVIDYDGTEWRANAGNGFFSDNFDVAIHPEWTVANGSWSIVSNVLNQNDEASSNTNIYATLDQDAYNSYLYHWSMKITGAAVNKRAGFHFMCDDPTLPNRGNSYFVWFREDDNSIQIYKVVSDVFTLEADIAYPINIGQWYDIKTVFDKTTGTIDVWVDNSLAASWTDPTPYTSGNSISYRSGNAIYDVNNLKVYHERSGSEVVSVGPTGDIRYQNPDPLTPSGKVKSIVIDSADNVSVVAQVLVNVDWTSPTDVIAVYDGTGADINITTTNTEISANWPPSSDQHSDIARYWYAIGTTSGGTDIVNWTDNWYDTTITHTGLSLTYGTTYYVSVKAENGAGLLSGVVSSDGQLLQVPTNAPNANFVVNNTYVCSSDSILFQNSSSDASTYEWFVPGANPSTSTAINPYFQFPVSGTYAVTLVATGAGGVDTTIQTITVQVYPSPTADFTPSDTLVDSSNPYVTFTNNSTGADGYIWYFGDGSTSNDAQPWHEYAANGTYTVILVALNGTCPNDTSSVTITVATGVGITENNTGVFSAYPNPTNGSFIIQLSSEFNQGTVLVTIYDLRGRIVYKSYESDKKGVISVDLTKEELEKGIYLLKVSSGEINYTEKLIFK